MAKIKITQGGCGIKYTDEHGKVRHALKTTESGPFECDDAQAERLVNLRVAAYVNDLGWKQTADEPIVQPDENQDEKGEDAYIEDEQAEEPEETEETAAHLDAAQLETMTNEQLKNLAGDLGVDLTGCKKKAEYIAALVAVEVDPDDEDDLPELSAADPE